MARSGTGQTDGENRDGRNDQPNAEGPAQVRAARPVHNVELVVFGNAQIEAAVTKFRSWRGQQAAMLGTLTLDWQYKRCGRGIRRGGVDKRNNPG